MRKLLILLALACSGCGPEPETSTLAFSTDSSWFCAVPLGQEELFTRINPVCAPVGSEEHKRFADCQPNTMDTSDWEGPMSFTDGGILHAHEDGSLHFGYTDRPGPATTSGPCSPANTGDGNTITMDCGEEKP